MQETDSLKKTPLYDRHVALNAKMVNFAGWLMPVYYSGIIPPLVSPAKGGPVALRPPEIRGGIIAEHQWTRRSCSVFDVSHLGEFHVKGPGAFQFLQQRLTNDLHKLKNGKILYNLLCDEKGFVLDDLLVYQNDKDDYYIIVNAANIERDFEAFKKYAPSLIILEDNSDETACIAIQGPKSEAILEKLFSFHLKELGYYSFKEEKFNGQPVWVSRSGYTGEDGFEIFSNNTLVLPIWDKLIQEGKKEGVLPAGLGARNTLRLEAGNALYGNDVDRKTTPLEAGLSWAVSFDKGEFIGRESLLRQKENGIQKRLIGFKMLDKPIAREHYLIFGSEDTRLPDGQGRQKTPACRTGREDRKKQPIGLVTSGSYGPSVGCNIGLGYVEIGYEKPGTLVEIEIYGKLVKAEVVKLPFIESKHKK